MKLLRELTEDVEYLKESKEGKESLYLRGPFAQAEVGNRNKRIYPLEILEREIIRYTKESIDRRNAFGELGHPAGPNINLDRTCIIITEMIKDGNNFIGKAKVTTEGMGKIVRGLIEDGARLGVSTRALGSIKLNRAGLNEVQKDLRLLAVDVVADPSGPDCWTDAIMEGASWIYEAGSGKWVEYVDETRKVMKNLPKIDESTQLKLFQDFLNTISNKQFR